MKEIIESVVEVRGEAKDDSRWPTKRSGYRVKTNKQTVSLLIDDYQDCCENYGWLQSEDDLEKFVGAELLGVSTTDTALVTMDVDPLAYLGDGDVIFVTLTTNKGPLQFAVYNAHNGYYGHSVYIESADFTMEDII